jgi:hypothetical protein
MNGSEAERLLVTWFMPAEPLSSVTRASVAVAGVLSSGAVIFDLDVAGSEAPERRRDVADAVELLDGGADIGLHGLLVADGSVVIE